MFHKKFEEKIVQEQAKTYSYQVPEKLYPSPQRRSGKNNETHQKKSCGETHHKCHEKSSNMRADYNK
jgi:hypothetical protein